MKLIEILYFDGCPGLNAAVDAVESVVADSGLEGVEVRRVVVPDEATAERLRFLGSPSIRVDGRDVEPDAEQRRNFGVQCRVYSVDGRLRNTPSRQWIESALGLGQAG